MTFGATLLIIWTLSIVAWSLRKRRYSWESRWEKGTNITIWFIGITALLNASIIGVPGMDYLPQGWETLGGSLFALMAASSFNMVVAYRAYPNPKRYLRAVHSFTAAATWALVVIFLAGELWEPNELDFHEPMEETSQLYWITFDLAFGCLLAAAAAVIITMYKKDNRHETVGKYYVISCLIGISGSITGVAATTTNYQTADQITPVLFALWAISFCAVSAFSWHRKIAPFKELTKVTGQAFQWSTLAGSTRKPPGTLTYSLDKTR